MIRVVERRFLALCIFVAAFVTTGPFIVMPAEPTVEVNPEPTPLSTSATITVRESASKALNARMVHFSHEHTIQVRQTAACLLDSSTFRR